MKRLGKEYIGVSISEHTLNTDDLIYAFQDFLTNHGVEFLTSEEYYDGVSESDFNAEYLNEYLDDLINSIAPEHTNFEPHMGNASDYGFWYCCPECNSQLTYYKETDTAEQCFSCSMDC